MAAEVTQIAAETSKTKTSHLLLWALPVSTAVFAAVFVVGVVWDWVVHEYEPYIRHCVRKKLLASLLAGPPVATLAVTVDNPGSIVLCADRPVLILGETGSGKTTALRQLIDNVAHPLASSVSRQPVPAIMISMRAGREDLINAGPLENGRDLCIELLRQIGFPKRRFFGYEVLGAMTGSPYAITLDSTRVGYAFTTLFSVCTELKTAAGSGIPASLLVFDSIEDLVRSDRLRDHGGLALFQNLARLFILNTNDSPNVYVVAAGSSAFLKLAYSHTVADPYKFRWSIQEMRKPSSEAVLAALRAVGHDSSTAAEILSVCGTRLRLLALFFQPSSDDPAPAQVARINDEAGVALQNLIDDAAMLGMSREAVVKALSKVIDSSDQVSLRNSFPSKMWNAETLSRVLYLNPSEIFKFQNEPMRRAFLRAAAPKEKAWRY